MNLTAAFVESKKFLNIKNKILVSTKLQLSE